MLFTDYGRVYEDIWLTGKSIVNKEKEGEEEERKRSSVRSKFPPLVERHRASRPTGRSENGIESLKFKEWRLEKTFTFRFYMAAHFIFFYLALKAKDHKKLIIILIHRIINSLWLMPILKNTKNYTATGYMTSSGLFPLVYFWIFLRIFCTSYYIFRKAVQILQDSKPVF